MLALLEGPLEPARPLDLGHRGPLADPRVRRHGVSQGPTSSATHQRALGVVQIGGRASPTNALTPDALAASPAQASARAFPIVRNKNTGAAGQPCFVLRVGRGPLDTYSSRAALQECAPDALPEISIRA